VLAQLKKVWSHVAFLKEIIDQKSFKGEFAYTIPTVPLKIKTRGYLMKNFGPARQIRNRIRKYFRVLIGGLWIICFQKMFLALMSDFLFLKNSFPHKKT
jgi:hypothetical protein